MLDFCLDAEKDCYEGESECHPDDDTINVNVLCYCKHIIILSGFLKQRFQFTDFLFNALASIKVVEFFAHDEFVLQIGNGR